MSMTKAVDALCPKWLKVDGHATAATVTGMKADDTIIQVLHFTDATGDKLTDDITADCAASSTDGSMTCPDTANDTLLVLWHSADGSAGKSYRAPCLKCFLADGAATELTVTGITANDTIVGAFHYTAGVLTDQVANSTCTPGAGIVTTTYGDTTGDKVLFVWHSADGGVGNALRATCIKTFKASTVAAPATAITVTGLTPESQLIGVWHYNATGVFQDDDTANCAPSTTEDDKMYSTTTFGATNEYLVVLWHDAHA